MTGLALRGIRAAPGATDVLVGVHLAVEAGQCVAVLGPSGAGKTTLLRVAAGLEEPTAGTVHVDGEDVTPLPPERRRLAVVFQDARLFPSMAVRENVAFPLRMTGLERVERGRRADAMLEEVGLAGFGDRRVRGLSGGEAQRVALARALVTDPAALLLDEPFAAVDPERRDDLRQLLDRLRRARHLPTLLVTHDRDDAALLGDRVAVLLAGRIAQVGTVREVYDHPGSVEVARFVGCDVLVEVDGQLLATRPERVRLGSGPHAALVTSVAEATDHARVGLSFGTQTLTARVAVGEAPPVGAAVRFDLPGAKPLPHDHHTRQQ